MHQRLQETICKYDFVKALTINHKKSFYTYFVYGYGEK